jgi:membrane protein required for colicin V production
VLPAGEMQGADTIILVLIGVSVVVGTVRGFVREAIALVTWLAAIWVAWRFSGFLHPYLGGALESTAQKAWVARGIVFVGVLLLGALVGHLLSWLTRTAAGLSVVDRVFGFLFGFTRGVIVVAFAAMLGHSLRLDREPWWQHSRLMPYIEAVTTWLQGYAGESRAFALHALGARHEPADPASG